MNGTLITFNGNEYTLQNDFGNAKVETTKLKPDFIPIGITTYGGIIYVVSHNPITGESEVGSFPSPERNIDPDNFQSTDPSSGISNMNEKIISDESFYDSGKLLQYVRRDLMNMNNFELSSGDKYAVYVTDRNNASNLLNNIDKIFDFKIANVNEGGLSYIENFNIYNKNEIAFDETTSGLPIKYDVYTDSSKAKLAIIVRLKTIDYFNFNVRETTDNLDPSVKKVLVHASSQTSCQVYCKGFLLNIYKESVNTGPIYTKYVYSDNGNLTDCKFQLIGFEENVEYKFEAIPYTQFQLYDTDDFSKFKKSQTITIGKDESGIPAGQTFYTDTFKYYIDDSYMVLDFNLKKRTNGQIYKAYMEFYDPWSNVSTIKEVSNFDLFGTNTIRVDVVNEPVNHEQNGGVSLDKISNWTTTDYVETLFTNRYRNDSSLRINHFYYVRICLVELDNGIFSYNDLYKTIITDKKFNDYYSNNNVLDYYSLSRQMNDITFTKSESSEIISTVTTENYLGDFVVVNGNKMLYNISNGQSDPDVKYFGYENKRTDNYKTSISYKTNLNNDIIGEFDYSVLEIEEYGIKDSNLTAQFTPVVNGTSDLNYITNNRINKYTFDLDNGKFKLDISNKLTPKLDIYTKAVASRLSYGHGNKNSKLKNGFTKYYLKDKFSPAMRNGLANIEMSGNNRFQGIGKYSNVSRDVVGVSALMFYCPEGIQANQHSDNFNIIPPFNNEYNKVDIYTTQDRCNDSNWYYFLNEQNTIKNQCFIAKQINVKNSNREKSYFWENHDQAIVDFVNLQSYVMVMPSSPDGNTNIEGYVIVPIKGSGLNDILLKINKLGEGIFYAVAQTTNYNIYYTDATSFSNDMNYATNFKFSDYGISYAVSGDPAFKFRFYDNNTSQYITNSLDENNVKTWLSNNTVTAGRTIVNSNMDNIFKTPAFASVQKNIISNDFSFSITPNVPDSVISKYLSSQSDLNSDNIWVDDPNIVDGKINTSYKQYESILEFFGFDSTTNCIYVKGPQYLKGSQYGCNYSEKNKRRTIDVSYDLLNANFEI